MAKERPAPKRRERTVEGKDLEGVLQKVASIRSNVSYSAQICSEEAEGYTFPEKRTGYSAAGDAYTRVLGLIDAAFPILSKQDQEVT